MNDPIEQARKWIVKGDHDLGTAQLTYRHIPSYTDTISFHCQQAVEKYLKGFLVAQNQSFRYSHDLVYLLDLCVEANETFANFYEPIVELQSYAVEVRYPNETINLTDETVRSALDAAKTVRKRVIDQLEIEVDHNNRLNL